MGTPELELELQLELELELQLELDHEHQLEFQLRHELNVELQLELEFQLELQLGLEHANERQLHHELHLELLGPTFCSLPFPLPSYYLGLVLVLVIGFSTKGFHFVPAKAFLFVIAFRSNFVQFTIFAILI